MNVGVHEARRRWPHAEWIIGSGKWASVASCDVLTVMLFATEAEADTSRAFIDRTGCGHACIRDHDVIALEIHDASDNPR